MSGCQAPGVCGNVCGIMNADDAIIIAQVRLWLRTGQARAIRTAARLSQAEVGAAVGTDMSQISRWESGRIVPGRESCLALARLYATLLALTGQAGEGNIMRAQYPPAEKRAKCTAASCEAAVTQFLIWQPSELMVLDGGLSIAARCGAHPADAYRQQIAAHDPDAVFWVITSDGAAEPGWYKLAAAG